MVMIRNKLNSIACFILLVAAIFSVTSCKHADEKLTTQDSLTVTQNVQQLTTSISHDLEVKGPASWLEYFDNSPQFFMAADGQLSFTDYHSAKTFIQDTLIRNMHKILLKWSDMRIDPLTPTSATIGSIFHEDITLATGQTLPFDGYFTGTAILTSKGWKLRNAHWSMKRPQTGK
jgi:hypothetical protein